MGLHRTRPTASDSHQWPFGVENRRNSGTSWGVTMCVNQKALHHPKGKGSGTDTPCFDSTKRRVDLLALLVINATFVLWLITGTLVPPHHTVAQSLTMPKSIMGLAARLSVDAVTAPKLGSGFFTPMCCAWHAWFSFLVGRVGTPAKVCRYLLPVGQPRTVCHPCLAAGAAGFKPVQ